ncbi:uncharacterized protein EV154DRAFT_572524 [Mucor mucedo]|uniref:uncharacterized protein n=1 Tax=Mucor mucedo TaxID=29922 RepID=UPI00221EB1FB|nr:uncharacterized protein EV154DRAFT_572524 [Mucor mucedo]KAI7864227.1 hypothetical protein EV154DRAFT_572524 [Mucor mucedo]
MTTENGLMRIVIPVAPQLTENTEQSEIEAFATALSKYYDNGITFGNCGLTIQYSGCYRFFCFAEMLKKDYPGFIAKFIEVLKEQNYTTNKIKLLKNVGNRFNNLLYYFKHGAFAIAALYTTNFMRELNEAEFADIIAFIQKDRSLTNELRCMKLNPQMLKCTGDLQFIDFRRKKAL